MQSETPEIHLRDYWQVLTRRRWTVITAFVILVTTVTVATFTMEPVYQASVQLLIERDNPKVVSIQEVLAVDAASTDYYQTQYEILKSDNLARRVIRRLDLRTNPYFNAAPSGGWLDFLRSDDPGTAVPETRESAEKRLILALKGGLIISPIRNSRMVKVSYESRDPKLAARIVNALADEYINYTVETKISASKEARSWLNLQVEDMRKKVEEAEKAFEKFKQTIPQQIREGVNTKGALRDMENRPEVVNNPFIQELRAEEIKLTAKLAELSQKYGPKHPQIIQLNSQLSTLRDRMNREIKRVVAAVMIEESPDYLLLKREAETNRSLYEVLLTRLKETTVTENLPQSNIIVVDRAQVPDHPVKPRKRTNVLLSMILGLLLGSGLAFFFEYLDNTVKSSEDIDRYLKVPFLGAVPSAKKDRASGGIDLIVAHSPKSIHAESYRTIRTGILLAMAERQPRTILVTSPGPMEGKTTTAANLAVAMAQSGNTVLLIDADLRNPRVHSLFGQDNAKGLSSCLVGETPTSVAVRPTTIPLLNVLTSGPIPPNPAELLGSNRMAELLSDLSERYDRILIDSPPVAAVTDATVLAKACDGVVLVVKESATTKDLAVSARKRLSSSKAKILGVVLNDANLSHHSYYYRYPYVESYNAKKESVGRDV